MTNKDKIINWHSFKVKWNILSLCLKIDNSCTVFNITGKYIWQICRETNNKHFPTSSKNRTAIFRSKFSTKNQCFGQKKICQLESIYYITNILSQQCLSHLSLSSYFKFPSLVPVLNTLNKISYWFLCLSSFTSSNSSKFHC